MNKSRPLWIIIGVVLVLAVGVAGLNAFACVVAYATGSTFGGWFAHDASQGPGIGLIRVEGVILAGQPPTPPGEGIAYSEKLVEIIRKADQNANVRAIVLRVNSPGGSVVASSEIYHALLEVEKPIVVSMGETAASGGYYIACAADKILANPGTLTGSIGVIAQMPNIQELLTKVGVDVNVIKSGRLKDEGSPFRPMTDEERAIWQGIIDESYDEFVAIVAKGRGLPEAKVRDIADGRVYTGLQAIKLGLVDEEGNLQDAVKAAGELADIEGEPKIIELYSPPSFVESLFMSMSSGNISLDIKSTLGIDLDRPSLEYRYIGG